MSMHPRLTVESHHSVEQVLFTQRQSIGLKNNKPFIQLISTSVKRNELSSHENTRRKLKHILLRERSKSAKPTYCMTATI